MTFRTTRVLVLTGVAILVGLGLAAFSAYRSNQAATQAGENAKELTKIKRISRETRTIVKPVCVTDGLETECLRLLRSADEGRVVRLCHDAADVLRESGIEAECVVRSPGRPEVREGSADAPTPNPSTSAPLDTAVSPAPTTAAPTSTTPATSSGSSDPGGSSSGGGSPPPPPPPSGGPLDDVLDNVCHGTGVCVNGLLPPGTLGN